MNHIQHFFHTAPGKLQLNDKFLFWIQNSSAIQQKTVHDIAVRETDTIISMPNGYGRSFCYQFPAAVAESKVTIVFCPDESGIEHKIQYLERLNIQAVCLSTETLTKDLLGMVKDLEFSTIVIRIWYVTIEIAKTSCFKRIVKYLTKADKLAYIAVEKAHYVSRRSLKYLADYREILWFRRYANHVPWIAVTNTDNEEVLDDIGEAFAMRSPASVQLKMCFRVNTHYDMVFEEQFVEEYDHLVEYVREWLRMDDMFRLDGPYSGGVIYCKTHFSAQLIAGVLRGAGIRAMYFTYLAGLAEDIELDTFEDFGTAKLRIIVTTVDYCKVFSQTNIRLIIHWGLPSKCQFNYYDTTGIAGLNNSRQAECRVYNLLARKTEPDDDVQAAINVANKCGDKNKFKTIYCMYLRWKRFFYDEQDESYINISETFQNRLKRCHVCADEVDWDEFMSYVYIASNESQPVQLSVDSQQFEAQDDTLSMEVQIKKMSIYDVSLDQASGSNQTSSIMMDIE